MKLFMDEIKIKDRIRKNYGDIEELADDILMNGLINPIVVNQNYELLAGERRLKACKLLGWDKVDVRVMKTEDALHDLEVEISENEIRKGFSKAETIDYAKRLEKLEAMRARERMGESGGNISTPAGRTRDIVAEKMGIGSGRQYDKEKYIVDHKEDILPEDFADWDEGRLSTNKLYKKTKEENVQLKKAVSFYQRDNQNLHDSYSQKCDQCREEQEKIKRLERELEHEQMKEGRDLHSKVYWFNTGVNKFMEDYGGYRYLMEEFGSLSEEDRRTMINAADRIYKWAEDMLNTTVADVVVTDSDNLTPATYYSDREVI